MVRAARLEYPFWDLDEPVTASTERVALFERGRELSEWADE